MFSSLKSSFWSIITFFLSIFLIRILLSKSYSGAITLEVVVVTLFFVAFSFVYLYLSLKEVNEEKDRLLNRYDTIRDRYKDLLNEDDLKNIINTEELKSNDKDYIDGRKKTYTKTWITFNVLMIVIVLILFFYMNSNDILSDTVEKISKFYNITLFYFE
ncbi:Uncharacterised protein [Providencia rettgeri]|nr:Uncharacterised protein [Providencia rettgeri]